MPAMEKPRPRTVSPRDVNWIHQHRPEHDAKRRQNRLKYHREFFQRQRQANYARETRSAFGVPLNRPAPRPASRSATERRPKSARNFPPSKPIRPKDYRFFHHEGYYWDWVTEEEMLEKAEPFKQTRRKLVREATAKRVSETREAQRKKEAAYHTRPATLTPGGTLSNTLSGNRVMTAGYVQEEAQFIDDIDAFEKRLATRLRVQAQHGEDYELEMNIKVYKEDPTRRSSTPRDSTPRRKPRSTATPGSSTATPREKAAPGRPGLVRAR
mmetsp:Transcript_36552/g.114527  ORF Transcript_36552/g.114527 Transcript_36552/m.114527 type:complete len:269 (-) Transcript_36552:367-1173(-)